MAIDSTASVKRGRPQLNAADPTCAVPPAAAAASAVVIPGGRPQRRLKSVSQYKSALSGENAQHTIILSCPHLGLTFSFESFTSHLLSECKVEVVGGAYSVKDGEVVVTLSEPSIFLNGVTIPIAEAAGATISLYASTFTVSLLEDVEYGVAAAAIASRPKKKQRSDEQELPENAGDYSLLGFIDVMSERKCCGEDCPAMAFCELVQAGGENGEGYCRCCQLRLCNILELPRDENLDNFLSEDEYEIVGGAVVMEGSPAEYQGMLDAGSLRYVQLDGEALDKNMATEQAFFNAAPDSVWTTHYSRRGVIVTSEWKRALEYAGHYFMLIPKLLTWFVTLGYAVVGFWMTCSYKAGSGIMHFHADEWRGDALIRAIVTYGHSLDGGKTMTFVNRHTGRWFTLAIPHGSVVLMTRIGSGTDGKQYWHKVEGCRGTYTFNFDLALEE